MPRTSESAKATLEVVENSSALSVEVIRRLRPPDDLTPEQRDEFQRVVSTMPAEWFTPANRAALSQYCRHVIMARRIAELIEVCISNGEVERLERLVKAQVAESRIINMLMTSLRMTPQAVAPPIVSQKRLQQIESPWSGFGKRRG